MNILNRIARKAVAFVMLFVLALALVSSRANAQTFDYSGYVTTLTSGATAVATVAGLLAGILVGITIFRKLVKYFNKSG